MPDGNSEQIRAVAETVADVAVAKFARENPVPLPGSAFLPVSASDRESIMPQVTHGERLARIEGPRQ